jgi:hypothetical protein
MSTKFIYGWACMCTAVLCVGGAYFWFERDSYWLSGICALGSLSWVYHAMRCVE